jgi:hypothetical protein
LLLPGSPFPACPSLDRSCLCLPRPCYSLNVAVKVVGSGPTRLCMTARIVSLSLASPSTAAQKTAAWARTTPPPRAHSSAGALLLSWEARSHVAPTVVDERQNLLAHHRPLTGDVRNSAIRFLDVTHMYIYPVFSCFLPFLPGLI